MGNYIFSLSLPPLLPPLPAIPLFALQATVPCALAIFFKYYCYFYWNSQWEPLQRREHQKPTILNYLTLQKKQQQKLLKTITYYFMHKLTKLTILLL